MNSKGKLSLFYGCMFSGKTTALLNFIAQAKLKDNEFIVFKPDVDNRAGNKMIQTHNGMWHECISISRNDELISFINPFTKLVVLDEVQFFDKIFLSQIYLLLIKGIHVVAAGLDKDFLARPFGLIPSLIEIADEKNHLKAKCHICSNEALYTYRKAENKLLVLIGKENYYEARCEKCYKS